MFDAPAPEPKQPLRLEIDSVRFADRPSGPLAIAFSRAARWRYRLLVLADQLMLDHTFEFDDFRVDPCA